VLNPPNVTAPIIGPRTREHLESQLTGAEVVLSDEILDRIDAINPPGVTLNHLDNGWTQQSLTASYRRR
jgi:aryl-alcohol dehydrogenase-like predicted oxidoreductase